jgi:hypothetical protein
MKAALLALAAVLLAPLASADATHSTTFTGGAIPYDGSATIPIDVTIQCPTLLVEGLGGGSAHVEVVGPAWLSATSTTVTFDAMECSSNPSVPLTKTVEVSLAPLPNAPGLVNATLNATLVFEDENPATEASRSPIELPAVHVAYRPGHVLTPDGDQTFTVTNGSYAFELTIDITANARTMIMFEDKKVSGGALLTGLQAHTFNVPEGEVSRVNPVKFTAPQGAWESVKVSFRTYSHCLDGTDCGPQLEKTVTWTFNNANPDATVEPSSEKESKGAPGLLLPSIVAALAIAALAIRRKA